jgi:hypothetical protein
MDNTKDTRLTMIDPKKAAPKSSTTNPMFNQFWAIQEARYKVTALMTNRNKPIVRIINPQDKKVRIGFTKALTKPRINAITPKVIHAFVLSTRIPSTIATATAKAITVITHRMISFISFSLFYISYLRHNCIPDTILFYQLQDTKYLYGIGKFVISVEFFGVGLATIIADYELLLA